MRAFPKLATTVKRYLRTDIPVKQLSDLLELITSIEAETMVGVSFVPPVYSPSADPRTKYSNPDVDRLTNEARATFDEAEREALLADVEQILGDDAVHVYLQTVNWLMGVNRERLRNFAYSGVYGAYYDRLWVET